MDKSASLILEKTKYRKDALAQSVPEGTVRREVFCAVGSISRAEWTAAANRGLRTAYRVTMWVDEYQGETVAVLDGVRYGIYRTYQPNADEIELYLEQKAGVTGGKNQY